MVFPKVALISLYHPLFGLKQIEKVRMEASSRLKQMQIELIELSVIDAKSVFPEVIHHTREACQECIQKDVDLVLLLFCTWVPEEVPNTIAMELFHYPMLLWAIPEPSELISPCGLISATSNFIRLGKKFSYVIGSPTNQQTMETILAIAKAVAVVKKLKRCRIGVVGYVCPGMIDVTFNEVDVRALGPELVHLDLLELLAKFEKIRENEVSVEINRLKGAVKNITAQENDIVNSVKLYLALREIVREHNLDAIGVRCWPELREQLGLTICYALARLGDEGTPGIDENDVTGGITQLVMSWLTEQPTFIADLSAIYMDKNAIQLWHCGAAPLKLALDIKNAQVCGHHALARKKGAVVEFPLKLGRVTIAKLSRPVMGEYRMLIMTGNVIETPATHGNPVNVKLDSPINQVLEAWVKEGIEHHAILAYGDIKRELVELCQIMKIKHVTP